MKTLKYLAIVVLVCCGSAMASLNLDLAARILAYNNAQMYHLFGLYRDQNEAAVHTLVSNIYDSQEHLDQYTGYLYNNWDTCLKKHKSLQSDLYALFKYGKSTNDNGLQTMCRNALVKVNEFFHGRLHGNANSYARIHNLPQRPPQ